MATQSRITKLFLLPLGALLAVACVEIGVTDLGDGYYYTWTTLLLCAKGCHITLQQGSMCCHPTTVFTTIILPSMSIGTTRWCWLSVVKTTTPQTLPAICSTKLQGQ